MIEIQDVDESVEIVLDGQHEEVTYTVFVKDTEGNFHVIKTSGQGGQSIKVDPDEQEYTIETIYVQIVNNAEEKKDVSVSIKIEGSLARRPSWVGMPEGNFQRACRA